MRVAFVALLLAHGFARLPRFLVNRQITNLKEFPCKSAVLSGPVDHGGTGIPMPGLLWLMAALGFGASAFGVLSRLSMWFSLTLAVLLASRVLSLLG